MLRDKKKPIILRVSRARPTSPPQHFSSSSEGGSPTGKDGGEGRGEEEEDEKILFPSPPSAPSASFYCRLPQTLSKQDLNGSPSGGGCCTDNWPPTHPTPHFLFLPSSSSQFPSEMMEKGFPLLLPFFVGSHPPLLQNGQYHRSILLSFFPFLSNLISHHSLLPSYCHQICHCHCDVTLAA